MNQLHKLSLVDLLSEHGRSLPDRDALVCGDVRVTWVELEERVDALARGLAAEGVHRGDRVLWLGQNCHRVVELVLSCARLGAIFCPANWRQTPEELAFIVDDVAPTVVFWQRQEIGSTALRARELAAWEAARWICIDDDEAAYEQLIVKDDAGLADHDDVDAPLLMLYTAAFEGRPNGALLSQAAILANNGVLSICSPISGIGTSHDTVFLNAGPMFHIGTLQGTFATLHMGGKNVVVRRVDPVELCELIDREGCTDAPIVAATAAEIVAANRDLRYNLTTLHSIPFSPEWSSMVTISNHPGFGYGQTELTGNVTSPLFGGASLGSHGRPGPAAIVRVVDSSGNDQPVGEVGEFIVRGPTVMCGYWNRPELNARRQRDGWHWTNDLGRREPDGSLSFIGPKERMIKSGAENIYPAEVENCLRGHSAVAEVGVIGVPDERWVQAVRAIVVLKPSAVVTADELIGHCRDRIASYKKPRDVVFVASLPRVGAGVDYEALDAAHGGGGYPGRGTRTL